MNQSLVNSLLNFQPIHNYSFLCWPWLLGDTELGSHERNRISSKPKVFTLSPFTEKIDQPVVHVNTQDTESQHLKFQHDQCA